MSATRFPTIKEAFVREHSRVHTKEEVERLWQEHGEEITKAVNERPPLEENRVYTPAEQRAMHWIQMTQYYMSGPPSSKPAITMTGIKEEVKIKPKEFVKALPPGEMVEVPTYMPIASVRTASYNGLVKITTRYRNGKWFVMRG